MATTHAIYPADDGLNCMRAIVRIVPLIVVLLIAMLIAAKSVWPDDINPRKEYRMILINQWLESER